MSKKLNLACLLVVISLLSCVQENSKPPCPEALVGNASLIGPPAPIKVRTVSKTVHASYYGKGDGLNGKRTASGEKLNAKDLTAAHRSLPFGTKVHLTNPQNGKTVTVRINDRGPFIRGREIDLTYGAAQQLGICQAGFAKVVMNVLANPVKLAV